MLGDNFIRAANGAVFKLDAEKILLGCAELELLNRTVPPW